MAFLSPQVVAAIILLAAGLAACFLGYRLFRWLLVLYGFAGGAWVTSLFVGTLPPWTGAAVVLVGGLAGAAVLLVLYLAAVAVAGAGVGVLVLDLSWTPARGEPEPWMVILACLVGASLAVMLQRYVIIVATAFGGAWTALVGALALVGHPGARAVAGGDLWQMYPLAPARGQVPFAVGWLSLGLLAAVWQLLVARSAKLEPADSPELADPPEPAAAPALADAPALVNPPELAAAPALATAPESATAPALATAPESMDSPQSATAPALATAPEPTAPPASAIAPESAASPEPSDPPDREGPGLGTALPRASQPPAADGRPGPSRLR